MTTCKMMKEVVVQDLTELINMLKSEKYGAFKQQNKLIMWKY